MFLGKIALDDGYSGMTYDSKETNARPLIFMEEE